MGQLKTVEQDLYDLLSSGPQLAGIEVSYGESFLEDENDELVNIIVSSCQLNEDMVSGDVVKFNQLTGAYSISIFITAANYMRANTLLNNVGDTLIQQPSDYKYYFDGYNIDADNYINHVQIELSINTKTNFVNRTRGN
jgi:hypothetical protein